MKIQIYHKDGRVLTDRSGDEIEVHSLEYNGEWMGQCGVTINFATPTAIDFSIGDWFLYRGERFELNYDPGKVKQGRSGALGDSFKYDSVVFNSMSDELARCDFLDVVLTKDNNLHYTALPTFSFYIESLDDLLDRLQANLNEQIGSGLWKLYSRNWQRSKLRGCDARRWEEIYGGKTTAAGGTGIEDTVIDSTSVSINNQSLWDGLSLVNSQFDVNFIVRGREVFIGTAGLPTANIFKYGKGKGLYEIEQSSDSDQKIVTRLRAYGSSKNLPTRYYATLNIEVWANARNVWNITQGSDSNVTGVDIVTDLNSASLSAYFRLLVTGKPGVYAIDMSVNGETVTGTVRKNDGSTDGDKCLIELRESSENPSSLLQRVSAAAKGGSRLYFTRGVTADNFPDDHKSTATANLPNNMACDKLMLPGFPNQSLQEWWDSQDAATQKALNPTGATLRFSTDKDRPWVESGNADVIGVRSGSVFFDNDDVKNKIEEIYPTLEEMTVGGVRVDEIATGSSVDDNGVFKEGQTVPGFSVTLSSSLTMDLNDLKSDGFSMVMKDGMCAGRSFSISGCEKKDGRWVVTMQRDEDGGIYYPYRDFQINAGDHFVLVGIEMPKEYVEAASVKLLWAAIRWLLANDYTRYTYQPKVDEIFMAKQHKASILDTTGATKSLHDTLKEGDIMLFEDEDLGIDGAVTISQLTIREEDGKIPTYDITLREDKEVGSLQKMQEQITTLIGGNGGGGGGLTIAQTRSIVESEGGKHFLSKTKDDTAKGLIGFEKGLTAGAYKKGVSGGNMDSEGNAETGKLTARGDVQLLSDIFFGAGSDKANTPHVDGGSGDALLGDVVLTALRSKDFDALLQRGFGFTKGVNGKFTLSVTDLMVWGKAIFNELEIRRLSSIGGNVYLSGASSRIAHVEEVYQEGTLTGWRCYILADDGTTATQNSWKRYDQARCQTFDIASGSYAGVGNRSYWRLVTSLSVRNKSITDADGNDLYNGKKFAWVVLSATDCEDAQTNDIPQAGDVIVLDGHRQFAEGDPRAVHNDTARTNVMMLQTTGSEGRVPNIISLQGIVDYRHSSTINKYSNTVFILSPEEVVFLSSRFKWISASGQPITLINFRGSWDANETYYYYDQVSHNNAIWTCIVAEDGSTTEEPTDTSTVWRKELTGGVPGEKGDKGDKGDPGDKGDKGDPGVDGTDGVDGVDGANGYTVTATPSAITLGIKKVSDTEFVADVSKNNTSTIRVFKGDVDVTTTCRVMVANTKNCTATGPSVGGSGLIKVTRMSTYTTAEGETYPLTSGSVTVDVRVGSATLSHTIAVNVEMSTVWGGIETSVKGLKTEFGELQQDLQSEAPNVLTKYTSKIEQTTKSISAKVAQETVGRLNLLPGTAFNREADVTQQRPDTFPCTILPLGGLEGTGAMVINQKGATGTTWSGLVWKGVVLKPKTYYTASVWARADGDLDDVMYLSIGQDTIFCYLNLATANETHDWNMFKATFKTGDTEAICNNVRVELAVRKNGRGRCCKLMLDESATYNGWTAASYADVSSRALEATGIDIKHKTIDMTADKFTLRNNHGEKSFGVDEEGNLEAYSLKSVSKDGQLSAIVKDGAFTALSGLSGATAFFGLIDGLPYLQFTNAAGVVCYAIGPSGGQTTGSVGVQMVACNVGYSVTTVSPGGKSSYMIGYSGSVTLQNFGSESAKIYQNKLQLVIDGFTQTLTAGFKDSSFPLTEVGQGKIMTLMPGKLMQAEFEINLVAETMSTTGSDGSVIAKPSGARGCQLKLNGEVIGKGAIS